MSYADAIVGAAIFDLNGLPKDYFTTPAAIDMSWVQTIFQSLGLRSLLMSSLRLEGFHHVTIRGTEYSAVVVKQKTQYVALLVQQSQLNVDDSFVEWVQTFEPSYLQQDPRFQVV